MCKYRLAFPPYGSGMNWAGAEPVKDSLVKNSRFSGAVSRLKATKNSCEILNTAYLVTLKLARVHIYHFLGYIHLASE